uniref:Malectin-like domain-containing protein n=1 Tax=Setaria italica TaxID=4555 RepID=K3YET4_SETIT
MGGGGRIRSSFGCRPPPTRGAPSLAPCLRQPWLRLDSAGGGLPTIRVGMLLGDVRAARGDDRLEGRERILIGGKETVPCFISMDYGLPGMVNFVDGATKLSYAPDVAFTDAGLNENISVEYVTPTLAKRYLNVHSFPDGEHNCYTLRSLMAGLKYLLRAEFRYGNYNGLNRPPIFNLYAGVNFWSRVNVLSPDSLERLEAIVVVPDDYVQVCLVNTGSGTLFISALELRPLKSSLYEQANAT